MANLASSWTEVKYGLSRLLPRGGMHAARVWRSSDCRLSDLVRPRIKDDKVRIGIGRITRSFAADTASLALSPMDTISPRTRDLGKDEVLMPPCSVVKLRVSSPLSN